MARSLVVASCLLVASFSSSAESLDELIASRALDSVVHPIAAEFVAAEGGGLLSEAQRTAAATQLKRALQRQTSPMVLTMRGTGRGSGITVAERIAHQWRVRDGKVVALQVYSDPDEAVRDARGGGSSPD